VSLSATIESKLRAALSPTTLDIEDDSASHAGHGASGAHVKVTIVSDKFTGLSLIARHRLVNGALAEELKGPIHALQIIARAPGE
jgi:BolA family transcriptional regulator, general stress-responsive regulator